MILFYLFCYPTPTVWQSILAEMINYYTNVDWCLDLCSLNMLPCPIKSFKTMGIIRIDMIHDYPYKESWNVQSCHTTGRKHNQQWLLLLLAMLG